MTQTLHSSTFDVRGLFTLTDSTSAHVQPLSVKTPIKLSMSVGTVANDLSNLKANPSIILSPGIQGLTNDISYDMGRGDLEIEIGCYAPSTIINLTPGVPNQKTVEFGSFVFSKAQRKAPDQIIVDTDDRFARFGVAEPKIYTRKISIVAESKEFVEFDALRELYGLRRTLSVYGFPYPDAYISGLSEIQRKPGLARWAWEVEFTCHKFESVDVVILDGLTLPTVISVSEEKKTPFLDDKCTLAGVNEPIGYSATRTVEFIDFHGESGAQLEARIGKSIAAKINGVDVAKCKITSVNSYHPKGGGLISIFVVELRRYYYTATDTVSFGAITLSNPTIPNNHDISPEYSVDMSAGITLDNVIPVITRRYAVECVTESPTEFENLVSAIGTKQLLTINGKEEPLSFISSLSALQPRGGGDVWKYTIEFSKKSGEYPIIATFNGISLPNCTASEDEDEEILSNRTILHTGKTAADISPYPAKRFAFTCMANDKTVYNQLHSLIGNKYPLVVDGETTAKAYISSWSGVRKIGAGTARLYIWTMGFEEETA